MWTTLFDVPILIVLALRTIRKIGHCYGYTLADEQGRKFSLGILSIAMSGSLDVRRQRLDRLRDLEDQVGEETEQEICMQEALSLICQLELFEEVPGAGAVSGAVLNLLFMRRVVVAARRVFQERWLRDNGLVREIQPVDAPARALAGGLAGALGRAAYAGVYWAGFGLALPAAVAATVFAPRRRPLLTPRRMAEHPSSLDRSAQAARTAVPCPSGMAGGREWRWQPDREPRNSGRTLTRGGRRPFSNPQTQANEGFPCFRSESFFSENPQIVHVWYNFRSRP